jgi:flagellar hook assembly protein FlgD
MKKIFLVFLTAIFSACVSVSYGAPFLPQTLKLIAPSKINYNFDGKNLSIPVNVTGTPANVTFLVYTKGKAESIKKITNGFLGWHYMNKVDTCVFFSGPLSMDKGSNVYNWDGKGKDKTTLVPAGEYTYYFFAFDDKSVRIPASLQINIQRAENLPLQEIGPDGKPLAQPYFILRPSYYSKWILGNDPQDKTLLETTAVTLPAGWAFQILPPAFLPGDFSFFFNSVSNKNGSLQGISKWQWVPNGAAILQTSWGKDGFSTYSAPPGAEPGVVTDGSYLYTGDCATDLNEVMASFYIFDFDGSIVKKVDLASWWSNPNDMKAGGQMNGGPRNYYLRNGYIFPNYHGSCIKQMLNPQAENDADFFLWTNRNGDYILDHNFEEKSSKPWACNDFNVGPYTYNIVADKNLFSFCPAFDMGAVSFGLMGPDGTGIGYFAFSGETAQQKHGNAICNNGSAFDGIYTTINSATVAGIQPGIWYVAHDSIKGTISNNVGVKESAPSPFTVAQNSPNPFNPVTTIDFTLAKAGKVTVDIFNAAGQKVDTVVNTTLSAGSHSATWNGSKFSSGMYFYKVTSRDFSRTMKMTLLK